MKFREIRNVALNESYHEIIHASGLTILVMPKVGYSSAYAVFAAKYGSIDTRIALADGGFADIPEGTAHFLEHKLFESEELDAFERFAKTGASANAYTSFDRTGYLFSCTENFKESLEYYLILCKNHISHRKRSKKSKGSSGKKLRCTKTLRSGRFYLTYCALFTMCPLCASILRGQKNPLLKFLPKCCTVAITAFTT